MRDPLATIVGIRSAAKRRPSVLLGRRPSRPSHPSLGGALLLAALATTLGVSCSDGANVAEAPSGEPPSPTTTGATPSSTSNAAPPPVDWGAVERRYDGDGPTVAVMGDSILVATRDPLRANLDGYATKFAAVVGEGLGGGSLSHLLGGGSMVEIAAEYGADPPDIAVIELGTNDAWLDDLPVDRALQAIPEIVASLQARCVVVVAIASEGTPDDFDREEAAQLNAALALVADQVVDWPAIAQEPGSIMADGIHPTAVGAARLADAVAEAVERCRP